MARTASHVVAATPDLALQFPRRRTTTIHNYPLVEEQSADFEVDDGVGKLRRLKLIDEDGQGGLSAVSLEEAKRRLDETWDNLFSYNAPARA